MCGLLVIFRVSYRYGSSGTSLLAQTSNIQNTLINMLRTHVLFFGHLE